MGTTSQKLTYLNDTKGLLKDSINSLGGNITSQTTFRQYATELDSIYSKLPKVSGTGTNISLSPTKKGRIGSVINGDTFQNGTPSPSSPIPIQSTTGLQNIKIEGKNLYKVDNIPSTTLNGITYSIENGVITLNGTATSGFNITLCGTYDLLAGTYTLSTKEISGTRTGTVGKYVRQGSTNVIDGFGIATTRTVTLSENYSNVYNYLYIANGAVLGNYKVIIQMEKGSTATEKEIYQTPQEYEINLGNIHLYEGDQIIGTPNNWSIKSKNRYLELPIVDMNNSENYPGWTNQIQLKEDYPNPSSSAFSVSTKYVTNISQHPDGGIAINMSGNNAILYLTRGHFGSDYTQTYWKTNYSDLVFKMVYELQDYETTPITNTELIEDLNNFYNAKSYNGQTNISVEGDLQMILDVSAIIGDE